MSSDETVCVWADDTYCLLEDLEDYLTLMSDDFEMVHIDSERARALIGE